MKQFLRETDQFFAEHMPETTRRVFYALVLTFFFGTILKMFTGGAPGGIFDRLLVLTPSQALFQFHIWQFVTYMLGHADFFHLFFNVLALFFFGGLIERQMGPRRFFAFLLTSGVFAGFLHLAVALIWGRPDVGVLGFSGAVFAVLAAAVIWFPRMRVLVMFLFPVPLRVLAIFFGVIWGLTMLDQWSRVGPFASQVSNLAHLGGIIMGVALVKNPGLLDWLADRRIPILEPRRPKMVRRTSMGHPGRHSDPDDLYDDPHWKLDQ